MKTPTVKTRLEGVKLRAATVADVATIRGFIEALADYEKLRHECVATDDKLRATLFGERPAAEVILAEKADDPVGFALFFTSYSTFLAQPGIYLEDLFVLPAFRGEGIGTALVSFVARLAVERGYGRVEWSVLNWNEPAIRVYRSLGASPLDEWTVQRVTGPALTALAARFTHEFAG